jgi:predicted HTH domain antitoxin
MQIKIALPDDLGHSLEAKRGNLEDKLLEMIVVQSYCEGSISVGKVGELLGMKTRLEIDAFF